MDGRAAEARDEALENAGPEAAGIAVGSVAIALKVLKDRGGRLGEGSGRRPRGLSVEPPQ